MGDDREMTTDELKKELIDFWHKTFNIFVLNDSQAEKICKGLLEPREKRIEELEKKITSLEGQKSLHEGILWNDLHKLEKENAKLKEENKVLAQNLEDTEILNKTYEKRFNNLKKENTELKNKLEHRNCLDCSNHSSKLRMKTLELEKECTNAKEIISEFVEWANWQGNSKCPSFKSIQDKAEQFLNSEVENDSKEV
jgi:predicted RNase H-like nuclease (RuvC/YqgF family)